MKKLKLINTVIIPVSLLLLALSLFLFIKQENISPVTVGNDEPLQTEEILSEGNPDLPSNIVPLKSMGFANARYVKIIPGGSYQIVISPNPENANESVFWETTNSRIAYVDDNGMLTGLSEGETMLYAKNYTGKVRTSVLVQVIDMPDKILNVPYINQLRDYPNGCESVSTVMALNYVGIDISVDGFIDSYLDMAPLPSVKNGVYSAHSPWYYFLGDPREASGLCCYAPCIGNALNKFVDPEEYVVQEHYNVPLEDLCRDSIKNNVPVIFWGTMYMDEPYLMDWSWQVIDPQKPGERFTWVAPMHCMLLIGFDDENYYFNDPVAGKGVAYSKEDTEKAYAGLYYQAVTVTPKKTAEKISGNSEK